MSLHLITTSDERLVGGCVVDAVRAGLACAGRALVLAPSLALSLEAQRGLAAQGVSMGVDCATPATWTELRWALYGDGRSLVSDPLRTVLMARLLLAGDNRPMSTGDGTVELLCQVAKRALPWLPGELGGLSAGEQKALDLLHSYQRLIAERGMVEPCEAQALLPSLMAEQGAVLPACVMVGFGEMRRSDLEFAVALSQVCELRFYVRSDGGPASRLAEGSAERLASMAALAGVEVVAQGVEGPAMARNAELAELVGALYRPSLENTVRITGTVSLLEPAGPLAVGESACQHLLRLSEEGMRRIVVVCPDVEATWRELAPKLRARGVDVRAQVSHQASDTRMGAGFIRYATSVAKLANLAQSWPDDPEAEAPDMSWWPPRDLVDFMMLGICGVGTERTWRRDSAWRGNRILTPMDVLKTLQNPKATSPRVAAATKEVLQGHLAAAAGKLMGLGEDKGQDGSQGKAQGATASATNESAAAAAQAACAATDGAAAVASGKPDAVIRAAATNQVTAASEPGAASAADAEATPAAVLEPSAEEVLSRDIDEGALKAVAEAGRAIRDAGISLESDAIGLEGLVLLANTVLKHIKVFVRSRLAVPDAACTVELMSPAAAAKLAPCSADALLYLNMDADSCPIPQTDGALERLLERLGADEPVDGLAQARAGFAAAVRVPTARLSLLKAAHDASAEESFPAVMLTEVLSCYPYEVKDHKKICLLKPLAASRLDEGAVEVNLSGEGVSPRGTAVEGRAAAGQLDPRLRRLVMVPRDGQAELPQGRPMLSASQVETYLECPYKWFTLRRLGLDTCDADFSNMQMGTFAHRVLEVTHRRLFMEAAVAAGLIAESSEENPEGSLFWFDPKVRVEGSRVGEQNLEHALELLHAEFAEHLSHQRLEGSTRNKQALIPHVPSERRRLAELEQDLASAFEYEAVRLSGFEPRLFEGRFGGSSGLPATYAGADFVGTIDRIDVDAEGRALVIDYKHKSNLFDEYALIGKDEPDWRAGFALPGRVQTLVYAGIARELLRDTDLQVVGAIYLGTKGKHAISGALSPHDAAAVLGPEAARAADRLCVPVPGARSFDELLDRTEEALASVIDHMRAGDIEARPATPHACDWCPVTGCERRQ